MAVNMKLGVDLGSFNSGINQAKAQLKTFDAALKSAESQFKATGDAESALTTKMSALNGKFQTQKKIVEDYRKALDTMTKNNVDPLSSTFQKMQKEMLLAEAAMYDTQTALQNLSMSEQEAANSADKLTNSVNSIGKKISLDQVISGINKITDGLEGAARKAVQLGNAIWNEVIEQASKADDIATKAMMYDLTPERYQAMQKMANTWSETSVDMIMKARQRVQGRIGDMTDTLMGIGVDPYINKKRVLGTKDQYTGQLKDWEDIFWETGEALMNLDDKYQQANAAQEIFGQKWESLKPMFEMGRDAYEAALEAETVASAEAIEKLAKLNDTVTDLKSDFESLEQEVLAGMAPALTKAAEVLDKLLADLMEYLQKPEGQQMLERMEQAVAGIFEDLANIDPEDVVNNFVNVFNTLVSSFEWIQTNWSTVESGLKAIVGVWTAGKVTNGALTIIQLINGLRGLTGAGAGGAGEIALRLGGKLAFNGIDSTLGTSIGGAIANVLTSTPMTVAIAAASIVAIAHGVHEAFTATTITDKVEESLIASGNTPEEAKAKAEAMEQAAKKDFWTNPEGRNKAMNLLRKGITTGDWSTDPVPVPAELVTPENEAEAIAKQVGEVTIPVSLRVNMGGGAGGSGGASFAGGGGGGLADYYMDTLFGSFRPGYANGIPWVPDTRLAWLHPGERVLTAGQNRSYTANSNLYVERMIMNNGQDAEGLAAAMAAQNRRVSAGFGA